MILPRSCHSGRPHRADRPLSTIGGWFGCCEEEEQQARARARRASWSTNGPRSAFITLGPPSTASVDEIRLAYRRRALQLHRDEGGDHAAMVQLNAASEEASEYAAWRG